MNMGLNWPCVGSLLMRCLGNKIGIGCVMGMINKANDSVTIPLFD